MPSTTLEQKAAEVIRAVSGYVARALAPIATRLEELEARTPEPGPAGKDCDPEVVRALVADAVAAIPAPKDGADGATVEQLQPVIDLTVARAMETIPRPKDGTSVPIEDVQRMVNAAVKAALAELPSPKDGEPGRDATHLEILPAIDEAKAYSRNCYATHRGGLWRSFETTTGMKGWECIVDGACETVIEQGDDLRTVTVKHVQASGKSIERTFALPALIYRGIWQARKYAAGDSTTRDGCLWIALGDPDEADEPGSSKMWQMAAKKGRDGRDGTNLRVKGPVKL